MESVAAACCAPDWREGFLRLLPRIERRVRRLLRRLRAEGLDEAYEEACGEAVAHAAVDYRRLVELGREAEAFATPLATYAVRQTQAGRRVGSRASKNDAAAHERREAAPGHWLELVADPRVGPAELAATRIDFRAWLDGLPRHKRRVALMLAGGESTGDAARRLGVSPGRVSGLRRELADGWRAFMAEAVVA